MIKVKLNLFSLLISYQRCFLPHFMSPANAANAANASNSTTVDTATTTPALYLLYTKQWYIVAHVVGENTEQFPVSRSKR